MKKYLIGFTFGIAVSFTTVAFASNVVNSTLFPTIINFHVDEKNTQVDGTGDNSILNYNNQAYVPLRIFSENIGATVDYRTISSTDPAKHQIDIYQEGDKTFTTHDTSGYVSIGNVSLQLTNNEYVARGILKINKPFDSSRTIQLSIMTNDTEYQTRYFNISNPENKPLQSGDIREFTAYLSTLKTVENPSTFIDSITLSSELANWKKSNIEDRPGGILIQTPFNILFGLSDNPTLKNVGGTSTTTVGTPLNFRFSMGTTEDQPIYLKNSLEFFIQITNEANEVVWVGKTPALTPMEVSSWRDFYILNFKWGQRDNNGDAVPAGKYMIRVIGDTSIQYSTSGSEQVQTEVINESLINRAVSGSGILVEVQAN